MEITGRAKACVEAANWRIKMMVQSIGLRIQRTDAQLAKNLQYVTEAIAGLHTISVNRSRSRKAQVTVQSIQPRALINSFIADIGTYGKGVPRFSAAGLLDMRTSNSFSTSSRIIRRGFSMGVVASGWDRGGSQS